MPRSWVWLQLLIGWIPVWALFVALILTAHADTGLHHASLIALRMIVAAALLGFAVQRLTERIPWPRPMRLGFVATHGIAALLYAVLWLLLNSAVESVLRGAVVLVVGYGLGPFLVLGVWLYVMVAGVSYATRGTERAARAEALAAKSQLAALRGQLNPHFLFNTLHAVVQLIPKRPGEASRTAEQLASLLRTTIEEDRDLVSLAEEWTFVERYLDLERVRFGDRLEVHHDLAAAAGEMLVPSFSIQTLVENAVRHGAAPRVESTAVNVVATTSDTCLTVSVSDSGPGADPEQVARGNGTGLRRLRERLAALYGDRARLDIDTRLGGGFTATLVIRQGA